MMSASNLDSSSSETVDHQGADGCDVFPLIGFATLTKMAFDGVDLTPLWDAMNLLVADGASHPGQRMDLALIAQLRGLQQQGLAIQQEVLEHHRLFLSPCDRSDPTLRVLAIAAPADMGGNTPIEFLVQGSGIELTTMYVIPGTALPLPLPDHDVAIVIASESVHCPGALEEIDRYVPVWPRPLLNPPQLIMRLERDQLYKILGGIKGLSIPATIGVPRDALESIANGQESFAALSSDVSLPIIARPRGSHAGRGLARIDSLEELTAYLAQRPEPEFFVSRFVDYANDDGRFRKYRIVAVEGKFFPCHMAIAEQWDIWYLNAGMLFDEKKRSEEAAFMDTFDHGFAERHRHALGEMAKRLALNYFTVDCAEDHNGDLLIFEVDHTAVVHNMDPPEIYPYKAPQMHAIFNAFSAMLQRAAVPSS